MCVHMRICACVSQNIRRISHMCLCVVGACVCACVSSCVRAISALLASCLALKINSAE